MAFFNKFGGGSARSFGLGKGSTPSAPTSLSAVPSNTSVAISFTAPISDGGFAITNYEYSTNGTTWTALSPTDATSPVTVSGLTENTAYTVYLRAVTAAGRGASSQGVSFTTAGPPTGAATITSITYTSTTATVTSSIAPGGGAFDTYSYRFVRVSTGATSYAGTLSNPAYFSTLLESTQYTFYVRGSNAYGSGPESAGYTFTTLPAPNVEYLVVAGGGGAGASPPEQGGGGGGGGYRTGTLLVTVSAQNTVTVGGGGATNSSGANSVFSSITSIGGGNGGVTRNSTGGSGGSGGGGGDFGSTGGSGTAGQGNNGGSVSNGQNPGGGGGGAGGAGQSYGQFNNPGGAGVSNSIGGSAVTYAAGGKGGGDGAGPGASPANTGKGGDGGENSAAAGGSGIVILKYPDAYTATVGAGLTSSTSGPSGGYKVTTITAGTGNVSWA